METGLTLTLVFVIQDRTKIRYFGFSFKEISKHKYRESYLLKLLSFGQTRHLSSSPVENKAPATKYRAPLRGKLLQLVRNRKSDYPVEFSQNDKGSRFCFEPTWNNNCENLKKRTTNNKRADRIYSMLVRWNL